VFPGKVSNSQPNDFIASGAASLLANQALLRIKEVFHVEVPLGCLFALPTIALISEEVNAPDGK
jgi:hypothetical protein